MYNLYYKKADSRHPAMRLSVCVFNLNLISNQNT